MKYLISVFIVLLSISCEWGLEHTPVNSLTFGNVDSESDLDAILYEAAAQYRFAYMFNNLHPRFVGEYTDYILPNSSSYYSMSYYLRKEFWFNFSDHYKVIAQANIIIAYVDKIAMSNERKKYYTGAAAFYKALCYFDIMLRIGDAPIVKDNIEIQAIERSHWTEVCKHAIDLARIAVNNLPKQDQLIDGKGAALSQRWNPSKGAANAILSELAAWMAGAKYLATGSYADYDENVYWKIAEQACSEIIEDPNYALVNVEEVATTMSTTGLCKESIFEVPVKDQHADLHHSVADSRCTFQFSYEGFPVIPNFPYDLAYLLKRKDAIIFNTTVMAWFPPNDKRRYSYFYDVDNRIPIATNDAGPVFRDPNRTGLATYPYKFREIRVGTVDPNIGKYICPNVNLVRYRLADIYLLRAECRVRLGDQAGAIKDLNTVRGRAEATPYETTEFEGDLQMTIFKEREKELVFEGKRYIDVIRNGYVSTQLQGKYKLLTIEEMQEGALTLPISDLCFTRNPKLRQTVYWKKQTN